MKEYMLFSVVCTLLWTISVAVCACENEKEGMLGNTAMCCTVHGRSGHCVEASVQFRTEV